jgi:hypothetical protein
MPIFTDDPVGGVSYSDALKNAWVHGDTDVAMLTTITLSNPNFVDESGNPTEHYIVRDFDDLLATLEPSAPMNGGEEVLFLGAPFEFTRPSEMDDSAPNEIQLSIDNVSRHIKRALDQTMESLAVTTVTLREYLSTDTSAPHNDPVLVLELQGAEVEMGVVTARAAFGNSGNKRFPADIYDSERFPGLVE